MRRSIPLRTTAAVTLLGLAALAGCGDTSPDDSAAAHAAGCAAGSGSTVTVEIPEFSFAPDPVRIGACDSVVWANVHDQAHTSTGQGDQTWSTDSIAPGAESGPIRFEASGTFTYICALHPFMEGTVEVT